MPTRAGAPWPVNGRGQCLVFVVTRGDSIGGAQIHVRDLATHLAQQGWRPIVYTGTTGDLTEQLSEREIRWRLIPGLQRSINPVADVQAIAALARRLRRDRPVLVSTHTAKAGLVGRLAAWIAGIPAIFTAHGWQFADGISFGQKAVVWAMERLGAAVSGRIITVSGYDFNLARRFGIAGPGRLRLVHNGMPRRPPPPATTNGANPAANLVRIISVARFQEQKDHSGLVRALAALPNRRWELILVGDGPLQEAIGQLARQSGLADRIRFLGQRRDVPELLEAADLFVLASHWEGFPRSILEAMRAGLPVIASDVGGVREAVVHGETGLVVPRANHQDLVAALEGLIASPDLRRAYGQAGRARFETHFTFEAMMAKTWQVYQEVGVR